MGKNVKLQDELIAKASRKEVVYDKKKKTKKKKETRKRITVADALKLTNIVGLDEYKSVVSEVIKTISQSVGNTLGPGGALTMITTNQGNNGVFPTKDGYTVIKEFKFNDQRKIFIQELFRGLSERMDGSVGDGTTSGIPIADTLYHALAEYDITTKYPSLGCKLPFPSMRMLLDQIRIGVSNIINNNSGKYIIPSVDAETDKEYIRAVARVSSNGDASIHEKVSKLFNERTSNTIYITCKEGITDEDIIDSEVGFDFGSGYISGAMHNQPDRLTCKLDNPRFLLVDGPITANDRPMIERVIDYTNNMLGVPLVIIASEYDQPIRNMLMKRCTRGVYSTVGPNGEPVEKIHEKEPILALRISGADDRSRDRLDNIRIAIGGELIQSRDGKPIKFKEDIDSLNSYLGAADRITSSPGNTRILRGKGDTAAVNARILQIRKRIELLKMEDGIMHYAAVEELSRQIAMLNSDMTRIKVGGASAKERHSRKLVFDDCILACQAAITHGFMVGGNVTVPNVIANHREELIDGIIGRIEEARLHVILRSNNEDIKPIIGDFLDMVSDSFKSAYSRVVGNMVGEGTDLYNEILSDVYDNNTEVPKVFNLISGDMNYLNEKNDILVPANTDMELMAAVFVVIGTIVSSDQLLSILPGDATVVGTYE